MYFTQRARERKKEISSWYLRPCGVPAFLKRLMMKLSNSGMSSLESNSCVRVFRCTGFYREIPSILFFTLWFLIFGHKIIFFVLNQYMCFPPLTGQMYQQYQAPGGYPPPAGPQQQYGMQYPGNFNFAYLTKTLWFLSVCCMNILALFIIVLMMSYPVFSSWLYPPTWSSSGSSPSTAVSELPHPYLPSCWCSWLRPWIFWSITTSCSPRTNPVPTRSISTSKLHIPACRGISAPPWIHPTARRYPSPRGCQPLCPKPPPLCPGLHPARSWVPVKAL